jgi:hypothetical protein
MSEESKPVIIENKSKYILDIVAETQKQFEAGSVEHKITPGEAKRIELIRKMKQDTDKKEYMIMFNALMIGLSVVSLIHTIYFGSIYSLICLMLCLVYFVFIRKKLTVATLQLALYKNNFDKYLWEGFYLKEMRYAAVKLGYFIFFPFLAVFLGDLLLRNNYSLNIWTSILIAGLISTIGWLIFFRDDKEALYSIESDLKSLEYI